MTESSRFSESWISRASDGATARYGLPRSAIAETRDVQRDVYASNAPSDHECFAGKPIVLHNDRCHCTTGAQHRIWYDCVAPSVRQCRTAIGAATRLYTGCYAIPATNCSIDVRQQWQSRGA